MATPAPAPVDAKAEAAKMDLLEDDDEFEIDQGYHTMAAQAEVRMVSRLTEVNEWISTLQITQMNQANQVRFELDEMTSLEEAALINTRTHPGQNGCVLVNFELLKCKTNAKTSLEKSFNNMLDGTVGWIDAELQTVREGIALLRIFLRREDNQMEHHGPPLAQRNRGVLHCIYPDPPFQFPREPSFEHGNTNASRVPYQHAYTTQQQRNAAADRDRRAQRAIWRAKLRILEEKQSILMRTRTDMESQMRVVMKEIREARSDIGCGYADYDLPPLS